jgi:hypothetical protein
MKFSIPNIAYGRRLQDLFGMILDKVKLDRVDGVCNG